MTDPQITRQMKKLQASVLARGAHHPDIEHDTLVAARAELMNSQPNLGYVREILKRALNHDKQQHGPRNQLSRPSSYR